MPRPFWLYLIGISILCAIVFAWDKLLARARARRRISENALLLLVALGGTVGGLFSMLVFRHKNRKMSFLLRFFAIAAVQVFLGWLWLR